jgi:hypothetical protein
VRVTPKPWHERIIPADAAPGAHTVWLLTGNGKGGRTVTRATLQSEPTPTTYTVRCEACKDSFDAHHASRKYCPECATPQAKTARSRARSQEPAPS